MTYHPKFNLTDPAVAALLVGVMRTGDKFFVIDELGKCRKYPLKQKLVEDLNMEPVAAAALLRAAPDP